MGLNSSQISTRLNENIMNSAAESDLNVTVPHLSLIYCLDRSYLDQPIGGPYFVYARAAVDLFLTIATIFFNASLLFTIFYYRRKNRGSMHGDNLASSMKFVGMLAFSDILVAITLPFYLVPHYFCDINDVIRKNKVLCVTKYAGSVFSGLMSNLSLVNIAVDRYIAVAYTLKYRILLNHRTCRLMIMIQVVFCAAVTFLLYWWNGWTPDTHCEMEEILPVFYVIPIGLTVHLVVIVMVFGVHIYMYRKTKESSRIGLRAFQEATIKYKSVKILTLVTIIYFVCWSPYCAVMLWRLMVKNSDPILHFVFQLLFPLSYFNSLINPFIYAWKNNEIQNVVKWSLRRASR